jgi:predicted TIM-barrel fold metal-dependent hydrolase
VSGQGFAAAGARVDHTAPDFGVPAGACDGHVHVFGPPDRFPFSPDRAYTPDSAPVADLVRHLSALRLDRVVIVHPSPYGADNRCTVDALHRLGERARAIAVVAPDAPFSALEGLHRSGVRGVRVNLESAGVRDPAAARRLLTSEAARVAPLGWHVQMYTDLAVISEIRGAIEGLPVPLVIDHFGRAQAAQGLGQPGLAALLGLLRDGLVYVKLSAPYRMSRLDGYADAGPIAAALAAANPDRVLWGSDWPHPMAPAGRPRTREGIEAFRREDDGLALNRIARWVPGPDGLRRLLVDNPGRLFWP